MKKMTASICGVAHELLFSEDAESETIENVRKQIENAMIRNHEDFEEWNLLKEPRTLIVGKGQASDESGEKRAERAADAAVKEVNEWLRPGSPIYLIVAGSDVELDEVELAASRVQGLPPEPTVIFSYDENGPAQGIQVVLFTLGEQT